LEMKAEKRKLRFRLRTTTYCLIMWGDKDRIQQIIENLIVNSIKYGKIGGETEVAVVNLTKEKVLIRIVMMEGIENKIS
jgi:two-component system phosphate regulon sensor histidine kinase PhoR